MNNGFFWVDWRTSGWGRMQAYIQGRNVNLTFRPPNRGPVRALQNFDIDIEEGEFLSIVGPSGCGKSTFLNVLLGCGSIHPNSDASPNIAEFCDKGIQAKMDQALQMGLTDPEGANQLWAEVDHEMTDAAPWVDLFNPKQIDFLAKRVQNYEWNPQWYILYDQLWLKQ